MSQFVPEVLKPVEDKQEVNQPAIVVIVLTWNQRETTLRCLKSLIPAYENEYQILVWDNGSNDRTVEAVQETFPTVITYHNNENLGVAGGRNAAASFAIEHLRPSHLVFLDNDMVVEEDFVRSLYEPFTGKERLGQTQAKLRFMHDRSRINDGGGAQVDFVFWQIKPVGYGQIDHGQFDQVRPCNACGGAMMVRADVFRKLNGFDIVFNPFGPEDLDFSLRLQKAGYEALFVPQAVAYHVVSHSYGGGYSEEYAKHKSRHWLTFMRRHANPIQKLAFYFVGAPILAFKVIFREARRGNLGAIRGLMHGFFHQKK